MMSLGFTKGNGAKKVRSIQSILLVVILVTNIVLFSGITASAAEQVSFTSLLNEMVSRDTLAKFPSPSYVSGQVSSVDPASKNGGDWFANNDWDKFIRTEVNSGRTEQVLMDAAGPGTFTRFWIGGYRHYGKIRFYLDGSSTPAIEETMDTLMKGNAFVKKPFVWEAGPDLNPSTPAGLILQLPIPYASRCKITYDGGSGDSLWYNIEYRTYASGTTVQTFAISDYNNNAATVNNVASQLSPSVAPPQNSVRYTDASAQTLMNNQTINASATATVNLAGGAHAIRFLSASLANANEATLRSTYITITFDGETTINCPIGDFFGTGQGVNAGTNQYQSHDASGNMACVWTMPYNTSCSIAVKNTSGSPIALTLKATAGAWTWDANSMHFRANYRNTGNFTAFDQDINYIIANGAGVYVGDGLSLNMNTNDWWGEGDEKIYVDGESYPSHFGTGTEDYYDYSWGHLNTFQSPWAGQYRAPGGTYAGTTVLSRTRLLDGIPFNNKLQFDMENWNWNKNATVSFAYICYWYAKPGATVVVGGVPAHESGGGGVSSIVSGKVYKLVAKCSGLVLDVVNGSTADGAKLQQWTDNGSTAQQWKIDDVGNGYYTLTSQCSGKLIDIYQASTADGVQLGQWTANGGTAQKWIIEDAGNGYYKLTVQCSGKVMDVYQGSTAAGTKVQQYTWNGSDAQLWSLVDCGGTSGIVSGKNYKLIAKCSGLALDVLNGSTADGAKLQQWTDNGGTAQQWKIEDAGNGYYKLTAQNSGKVIDVNQASTADEVQLQQWTWNGSAAQLWKIEDAGGGYWKLTAQCSGKVMDVYQASKAAGTRVNQYTWNGTDAQLWTLVQLN